MVVIENAEAVHGAWHASVEASEAKQKATGESHPEEEDDSHPWFKSGHERRQVRTALLSKGRHIRGKPRPASPSEPRNPTRT